MNDHRRKALKKVADALEALEGNLDTLLDEEKASGHDNTSEGSLACDNIEEAIEHLEDAIARIDDATE